MVYMADDLHAIYFELLGRPDERELLDFAMMRAEGRFLIRSFSEFISLLVAF